MTIPGPLSVPTYLMLGIIVGLTGTVAYQCGVARQSRVSLLPVSTAVPVTSPAAVPPPVRAVAAAPTGRAASGRPTSDHEGDRAATGPGSADGASDPGR